MNFLWVSLQNEHEVLKIRVVLPKNESFATFASKNQHHA